MVALKEKYTKEIVPAMVQQFSYKTKMQAPRLEKIVLNVGIGDAHANPRSLEKAMEELGLITGQAPVKTFAKKSIAGFKIREGMPLGCKVTLRGERMFEFLERLINVALPRVRDFKGISPKGFDGRGNYSMSILEQIIFPEIDVDKVESYHGMNITMVTTAQSNDEAYALLEKLGLPYRKRQTKEQG